MRQYTSKPKAAPEPFELDGVTFTPGAGLSILDVTELARHAQLDMSSPEGMVAIGEFFKALLGADYERFRKHIREHQTDEETLGQVMQGIMEDLARGFPTRPSSDSPSGPTRSGRGLRVVSPSAGTVIDLPLTDEQAAELEAEAAREAG